MIDFCCAFDAFRAKTMINKSLAEIVQKTNKAKTVNTKGIIAAKRNIK